MDKTRTELQQAINAAYLELGAAIDNDCSDKEVSTRQTDIDALEAQKDALNCAICIHKAEGAEALGVHRAESHDKGYFPVFGGVTNATRAGYGANAVRNGTPDFGANGDDHTDLVDALANLMHYAMEKGFEFDHAVRLANDHFTCEALGLEYV